MNPTAVSQKSSEGALTATVLIVEDDPRSARMLSATLSASGYRVVIAVSGEQAQTLASEAPPDIVLCDVCLPGVDGIEVTRRLRSQEATRAVPVLLVTSVDDRRVLTRGLEAGADDFLTKPVNSVELRSRVKSLLRNKLLAEELRARERAAAAFAAASSPVAIAEQPPAACNASPLHNAPSVLLIEDNEQEARLLSAYLAELNCQLEVVHDAQSGLKLLEDHAWDLVVLDLILTDCSGYAIIEQMKSNPRHVQTPILVVSAMAAVQDRVKALELGADDFILKGFDRLEFDARVRRLLRLKESLDQLADRCDQALRQAVTDSLTGLFTHGFLRDTLQRQVACARRYGWPLSLLFLDIDHFKRINDQHGHATGDEVLRALADAIRSTIRLSDVAVRYGGEEFVVLMPHTARAEAEQLAERLRLAVETLEIPSSQTQAPLRVTISLGTANFPDDANDASALLDHADEAMYLAKQRGRNRVAVFGGTAKPTSDAQSLILIADDDPRNLRLMEAYLQREGHRLITACDGAEAIEIARRQRPDLILLDGMMPRLSGFDACRRLKQESATTLIPVILITALNGREDRLRGIEAGADDFLTKPIDKAQLLSRLRVLLRTKQTTDTLEDAETVIFALARAVESRDSSTGGHVERVSQYAVALGQALGLGERELAGLRKAGAVHDIGKIAVPDEILLKPGALTPEERKVMQAHAEVGYELLQPMRTFGESLDAVRFHHERLDGSGYPLGLRGSQIPLVAQIMAVADVYDALTSERVYRKALSTPAALGILRQEAARGLHDPALIDAFESLAKNFGTGTGAGDEDACQSQHVSAFVQHTTEIPAPANNADLCACEHR